MTSTLPAGYGTEYSDFRATTVTRDGSFELDMPPDDAFPLFTVLGEKLWIATWKPFILHGDGYEEGTVWVTEGDGRKTYWYVSLYDTQDRRARYVRTTPGTDTGMVEVSVVPHRSGGSLVKVTYRLTGLSDAGNANLADFLGEAEYAAMMEEWRAMIVRNRATIDDHFDR